MFEKSWTDAILSSLLWFFYHHLNGSSEYIRSQRSIPRFLHFAQKTRNNLFHCSLSSQELFLRPLMNPSRNSLLVSESCIQRKEIGPGILKVRMRGRRNEDVLDARGVVHLGTDLFIRKIGENCLGMQNVVFLLAQKFHKRQYLVLLRSKEELFPNKPWVVTVYMQMLLYI